MEIYVRRSSVPSFPDWLKWQAIREQAGDLWKELPTQKNPAKAQHVLEQLIVNPLMIRVWSELYKKKRINHKATGHYKYPACVTNGSWAARMRRRAAEVRQKGGKESEAKGWEFDADVFESTKDPPPDPRWSEQDRGAQLFLSRAYREYLNLKPVFLTDLKTEAKKFVEVAKVLRRQAATLQELKSDGAAQKLEQIASDCDSHAKHMLPSRGDDPWVVTRETDDVEVRVFVAMLSCAAIELFERELHSVLANVASVVFNKEVTRSNVREMLRLDLAR